MEEIWVGVIYNGEDLSYKLEVSNLGRLRNINTGKIYKLNLLHKYLGANISFGGRNKKRPIKVHRAVAESFIPNPENKPCINHIDGDKLNNCVNNLEWVTSKENVTHAYEIGLKTNPKGYDNTLSKLTKDDYEYIRMVYKPYSKEFGTRAIGRKLNVSRSAIRTAIKNMKDIGMM